MGKTMNTSSIADPELHGVRVRFFDPPGAKTGAPWHAIDDLCRAMGFDRVMRNMVVRHMLSLPGAEVETVNTDNGPVVIGSDTMARGTIRGGIEASGVPSTFGQDYSNAVADIWHAAHSDLDPVTSAWRLLQATGFAPSGGTPAA